MKKNFLFLTTLLALFEAITYLSTDMYLPALPIIQAEWRLTQTQVQLTLTWWFIGSSLLQLIFGPVADRYGRRPVLFFGGIVFIISSLIASYTDSYFLFTFCRFLQGTSVCTVLVSAYATIHELMDTKASVKAIAWVGVITLLAPAIGPLIGSIVMKLTNWRVNFLSLAVAAVIIVLLLVFVMPETLKNSQHFQIKHTLKQYLKLTCAPSFIFPTLIMSFEFAGFIAWVTGSPLLLMKQFHLTTIEFSVCQLVVFAGFILGTQLVKFFVDKKTLLQIVYNGVLIGCIGGLIGFVSFFLNYYEIVIIGMIFYSISSGLMSGPLNRLAMESNDSPMGSKAALFSFINSFFGVAGSFLINIVPLQIIITLTGITSVLFYYSFSYENKKIIL